MTFSLCMIVKNEEKILARCLDSVENLFDEIIIVDTGSTDKTKEIAQHYTNKIYDFVWCDDFSKARNYAFSKATMDYIMWLDADDIILKEDLKKLKNLKENLKENMVLLKYHVGFNESGKVAFSYYRERIFKRISFYEWRDRVHEFIPIAADAIYKDIAITHKSNKTCLNDRNIKIYEDMIMSNEKFTPRNLYYYGRELYEHTRYKEAIKKFKEFLNTKNCWIEDAINACHLLHNCYLKINKKEQGLKYLYKTFDYDLPRSKTCCLIGNYFFNESNYQKAIYWYSVATMSANNQKQGFNELEYNEFIPSLKLCVCYDKIGKQEIAKTYHQITKQLNPNHASVLYNEEYFKNLDNKKEKSD